LDFFSGGHLSALFGTVMTSSGAFLAMVMFMLSTLIAALLTNISAKTAERLS